MEREAAPQRLNALPTVTERTTAWAAYHFLMDDQASVYGYYVGEHHEFLNRWPAANERQRLRPLALLEADGIECALWPCLFWDVSLAFTRERLTNPGRHASRRRRITEHASPEWLHREHTH